MTREAIRNPPTSASQLPPSGHTSNQPPQGVRWDLLKPEGT